MKKELIMQDFKKLREEGVLTKDFNTYEELLEVLSEMFTDVYYHNSDAQEAFDELDDELDGLLNKHTGVYYLGTNEWSIELDTRDDTKIKELIKEWNSYYGSNIESIEDLTSAIEHRVCKDMSNAGCDVFNALAMLCNDVFSEPDIAIVDIGDENPRIEFLD